MAVATSRSQAVTNPSTLEPAGEIRLSTVADVAAQIERANAAFPAWRSTPFAQRAAILRKTAEALRAEADSIAALLTREQGKPLKEARIEVERCAD
ncbi:MAG: aldehyde dehydrogenase family protein, partial [Vulcanimicrobiaceae bacterium]